MQEPEPELGVYRGSNGPHGDTGFFTHDLDRWRGGRAFGQSTTVVNEMVEGGPHPNAVRPPRFDAHHLVAPAPGEGTGVGCEWPGRYSVVSVGDNRGHGGSFAVEGQGVAGP